MNRPRPHTALLTLCALATLAALCGCDPARPANAKAGVQDMPATTRRDAPKALPFTGEGVKVRPPVTLSSSPELVVQRQEWRADGTEGYAWRVRIARTAQEDTVQVLASQRVVPLAKIIADQQGGSWAAINGGFYERDSAGALRPMGVVIERGKQSSPYRVRGGSGLLVVPRAAPPEIIHRAKWRQRAAQKPRHVLQSIDRLVDNGKSLVKPRDGARSAARGAVVLDDKHVWLVLIAAKTSVREQIDGVVQLSGTSYNGMPLHAFAHYLVEHVGAKTALNMDGGISTQMIIRAGSLKLDILGEQGTINAVLLQPRAPRAPATPR